LPGLVKSTAKSHMGAASIFDNRFAATARRGEKQIRNYPPLPALGFGTITPRTRLPPSAEPQL
jgi:hypothetical protein